MAVAGAAGLLLAATSGPLRAYEYQQIVGQPLAATEPRAVAPPRELVAYNGRYAPGTIVISTEERRLYYILPGNQAVKYGIGVGRPGFEWGGTRRVAMKREWPSWTPPFRICRASCPGGPENPLGARAMYLGGEDVMDLYDRVLVGTRVVVLR